MKRYLAMLALLGTVIFPAGAAPDLGPGDLAPDFELAGSDGHTYRLSDYRGKQAVVLAWFPKANTGG